MRPAARALTATALLTFVLGGAVAARAGAASAPPPGPPSHLTVDDDAWPLAVEGAPAFGWYVVDPARGAVQTAYQIVVSTAPTTDTRSRDVVADTGRVTSAQQSYVSIPSLRLLADRSYWWTVRTWNGNGGAGAFAPPARFDTGLGPGDWHASWIRRAGSEQQPFEDFSLVRKQVAVSASAVTRARAYVSAGQQYDLRVNGTRVAHGPSYSYPDEQYYEATDITKLVRRGAPNVFAAVTHWSEEDQGHPRGTPGFIARITIDHADGTRQVVTTDASWQVHTGPWIQGPLRNDEGDFVEHVDERLVPARWDSPAYDPAGWTAAEVMGPEGTTPFTHLFAARTHLVEQMLRPASFRRIAGGAYVADFGSVLAATPVVDVHHGVAGHAVKLVSGYLLDPDGHVSTTRGVQQTDMHWDFDERDGGQELRPFGYLGFRYLEVDGAGEPLTADDVRVAARHASMPDEHAASFQCSDARVDAVWNLARHSALYDSQEQFLDTPTRERGPFLGDSYDVSQATMAAFGERALTFQALRDFARSQQRYWPDGRVNVVYPNGDGKRDIPDGTEVYPEWVWHAFVMSGDRNQLAALYPVARRITDYVAGAIDPATGLVTNLPGGGSDYLYGAVDWPPQMRYGYDMQTAARTTVNALAYEDFTLAASMARVLGDRGTEAEETARARDLASSMNARLTRADGVYVDGLRADHAQSTHASQQANAFPLAFGIVPPGKVTAVAGRVVALKNAMGVVNFRVLLDALHRAGRDDALVAAITDPSRPGYARMLQEGATFTWESWDARQTGDSESHGWGSTVLAVLQDDVLGAATTGAGRVAVAVPATSISSASGVVASQIGPVPVHWARDAAGHETIELTVPPNGTATVTLPARDAGDVNESSQAVRGDPGVTRVQPLGDRVQLTVGAGHYVFANTRPSRSARSTAARVGAWIVGVAALLFVLMMAFVVRRRRAHA